MDPRELAWRSRTALQTAADHVRAAIVTPRWNRQALRRILATEPELAVVSQAAATDQWMDAHAALSTYLSAAPQRFLIAPGLRDTVVRRIRGEFPGARQDAAARADRILSGEYDLLGYRSLRFVPSRPSLPAPAALDWHFDPVHDRRAPIAFWSDVPFLSPSCGDHKIIWELNRHQHWVVLGRAFWLTGDAKYRRHAIDQLAGWLAANPPLMGINWASMLELAFRSISWVWALNFFVSDDAGDRSPWLVDLLIALDRQLQQIARNLSFYFSPNTHLLGEALALYVAGRACPLLASSERYAALGRRVLVDEAQRQILPDGGHCERSTHYHRYTLDFYLLALAVARVTGDAAAADFERAARRLASAARTLADHRGTLPHIGDDDGGAAWMLTGRPVDDVRDSLAIASALTGTADLRVGPAPEEAFWVLAHPALSPALDRTRALPLSDAAGSSALPDTGYYVSRSAGGDHLVIDGGPHGYRNAGHAHADALSLTLSLRGLPLLVDPGTGCYTVDPALRDRLRSTALHNTVTIDGEPQSTPAGPFHWSHTADATPRRWRTNAGFDYFEGSHDGYRPLEHRRHVLVLQGDLLVVADLIAGGEGRTHRADMHWHIDPRWNVTVSGRRAHFTGMGERAELVAPQGSLELLEADPSGLGWHAPVYGRLEAAATLRISHTAAVPYWLVSVFGLAPANSVDEVITMPVWAEAGVLAHGLGIRVSRASSTDYVLLADPGIPVGSPADVGSGFSRTTVESGFSRTTGDSGFSPTPSPTWRLAEYETDARLLFCRTDREGSLTRAAMVDGTLLRAAGRTRLALTLPGPASDVHLDLRSGEARLSGQASGARLRIAGRDGVIEPDRRAAPRERMSGRSL